MATNIEQIFREFVINKIREIEDECQNIGVTSEMYSNNSLAHSVEKTTGKEVNRGMERKQVDGLMESLGEKCAHTEGEEAETSEMTGLEDVAGKQASQTLLKKNKKHKRPKSKKKKKSKKKRKEARESSWESVLESGAQSSTKPCGKNQGASGRETAVEDRVAGVQESADQPTLDEDGKTKKDKWHVTNEKTRRREEESLGRKSPFCSGSENTSASGTETESELRTSVRMPPTSLSNATLDTNPRSTPPLDQLEKPLERPLTLVTCEGLFSQSSGVDSKRISAEMHHTLGGEEKLFSFQKREILLGEMGDQLMQCPKSQDLPDIIPKLQSVQNEEAVKCVSEIPTDTKIHEMLDCVEKHMSHSVSRSKSRSVTRVRTTAVCLTTQKSRSRSHTQSQTSDKPDSSSVSLSRKRSHPRKKHSTSQTGKHRSRSTSLKKIRCKSRSLSPRQERNLKSISCTRNTSRSRSRRYTRSRSIVCRRRSRSQSHSRQRRTRSRSKRSQSRRHNRQSRSIRGRRRSRSWSHSCRQRSGSRSVRKTRRSRPRSLLRRNKRSRSRSLRRNRSRSVRRHQSKSRSPWRSRCSRSRSPARNQHFTALSPQCRKRYKSVSPAIRHRSTSKSVNSGQKRSKSPQSSRCSKLRSSSKHKSNSRSMCRDSQAQKNNTTLTNEKESAGSIAKEQLDIKLCPEGIFAHERTKEADGQCTGTVVHTDECFVKAKPAVDPDSITVEKASEDVNTDGVDMVVLSVGSWRPLPFLTDSTVKHNPTPVEKIVSSVEVRGTATEQAEECKSPKMNNIEMRFMLPQKPLAIQYISNNSSKVTSNEELQTCSQLVSASEDQDKHTELKCCSPKAHKLSEVLPLVSESTASEMSQFASSIKLESDQKSLFEQRNWRSPSGHDSSEIEIKPILSISPSKLCQSFDKKDSQLKLHLTNKKEMSSKQEHASVSPSPSRRKSSKSKSPSRRKKSKSRSLSHSKRSQSNLSFRRRCSKSSQIKNSKLGSPRRKRKSGSRSRGKSKSPTKRRRSRSKSKNRRKKSRSASTPRTSKRKRSKSRSSVRKKHSKSCSPRRGKHSISRSQTRKRRSTSVDKSNHSKSRSPARKGRSRSRSTKRSRSRRSRSLSRCRRGGFRSHSFDRRDRWRREPSHSPVLILRKKRSASRGRRSSSRTPPRLTELDKEQLLEVAKANAAAMCAKAGVPIPESLRPKTILQLPLPSSVSSTMNVSLPLPMNLPMGMSMAMPNISMSAAMASMTAATMTAALTNMGAFANLPPLPSITNKPPPTAMPNTANIEEVKRKVVQKANSISIKELTEKCKMIAESKEEMAVALPHVSDDEEDEKPFGGGAVRENKGISFSLSNPSGKANFAKEFPVSSGSQHRKKESDGAYGEWVPVDRKATVTADDESMESDSVFRDSALQPVDITVAVSERAEAQKRLAQNPFDVSAMCMLNRAQEQVDAWAQSNSIPGLFTGSTGAQVLSSEELSNSGPQAWIKKDQFLRAAPVSGGVGEFLMRKMGWRIGEGLGKRREGTVEPIVIDFKTDRKGLVAEGEKMQKSGSLVVMKDLLGKHPVSALMEMCNKKKWPPPEFVMVHHSGPDHRKNFLFKVVVNGTDYQPQTASPNKKHAKAMAATVALQAMGEVSGDSMHTGPVFTAATTAD